MLHDNDILQFGSMESEGIAGKIMLIIIDIADEMRYSHYKYNILENVLIMRRVLQRYILDQQLLVVMWNVTLPIHSTMSTTLTQHTTTRLTTTTQ